MAMDSSSNILLTGFSQNAKTNLGYATVKYAPNGIQIWVARYDSTNFPLAEPAALALDNSNNVIITGSALTAKYDSNGNELWTAPYDGASMAVDTNGNVAITGFGSSNATVKLNSMGSNLWMNTYPGSSYWGPGYAEAVTVDSAGNTYVAGNYPYDYLEYKFLLVKYAANGSQIWAGSYQLAGGLFTITTLAIDVFGNIWAEANVYSFPACTIKFGVGGDVLWSDSDPVDCSDLGPYALGLDHQGNAIVTGTSCYAGPHYSWGTLLFGTYKADTNADWAWTDLYPAVASQNVRSLAAAIAIDSFGNSYVTGWSCTGSTTGIVTIAYGPNGNQLWLQTYAAPSGGNAVGNAIAVDNAGNVYVAGYEDTGAGGTEFVLIKYSPVKLQKTSNGSMLLQTQGSPGEIFTIESSQNLTNWFGIGTAAADTNGLMQFTDTNAPNYPARFYNTIPQ